MNGRLYCFYQCDSDCYCISNNPKFYESDIFVALILNINIKEYFDILTSFNGTFLDDEKISIGFINKKDAESCIEFLKFYKIKKKYTEINDSSYDAWEIMKLYQNDKISDFHTLESYNGDFFKVKDIMFGHSVKVLIINSPYRIRIHLND